MVQLSWCFQLFCLLSLLLYSPSSAKPCSRYQTSTLLQFKHSFSIETIQSNSYSKLMSWTSEEKDCCLLWDGVTCDMATGHVIGLNLSSSGLRGNIPSNSSLFLLHHLQSLNLAYNDFNDSQISSGFTRFPNLTYLNLSSSSFSGQVPAEISHLSKLVSLDLSGNFHLRLDTPVLKALFQNLTDLQELVLDSVDMSSVELSSLPYLSSFPNLSVLGLSSCNLSEFPDFLRTQNHLQWLDLSENQIRGGIPNWICNTGKYLNHLNISHNFLTGTVQLPCKSLRYLDLRSNMLQGSLPFLPPSLNFIAFSNNKLSGQIPPSFCNMTNIFFLLLSNNSLSGTIPQCLANSSLSFLDLRMNNFHGSIPQTFAKGCVLTILNLNGNRLEGPLPPSLVNCRFLEVLDVGNNKINGTIPNWLPLLSELQVLVLRSNKFRGPITYYSGIRFPFPKLRILDLSSNELTGDLPTRYFQNFQAMMQGDRNNGAEVGDKYINYAKEYYSATLTVKGIIEEMQRVLNILTTIDLSSNRFQGRISEVVGKLNSLKGLNFSHNHLTGLIPSSLKNLTELEALDLSSNKLVGQIPPQLTSLNFLQVLNLSQNQLIGPIPRDKQFHTFSNDSYSGNLGLCGFPLSEKCTNDEVKEPVLQDQVEEEDDVQSLFDWKMAVMGYASGCVIGLSIGYFVFTTGRPQWFVRMIEQKLSKKVIRMLIQGGRGRRS